MLDVIKEAVMTTVFFSTVVSLTCLFVLGCVRWCLELAVEIKKLKQELKK